MNQFTYTSFEFSKKLKENGCEIENELAYIVRKFDNVCSLQKYHKILSHAFFDVYFAYDILWNICIQDAKKFFGDEKYKFISNEIFKMLQDNKPHDEIENYIWDNCVFNKEKRRNNLSKKLNENCKHIIEKFGTDNQKLKLIEELNELSVEIAKDLQCISNLNNIIEEIADVEIMLEQAKIIYDIKEKEINNIKNIKMERLGFKNAKL